MQLVLFLNSAIHVPATAIAAQQSFCFLIASALKRNTQRFVAYKKDGSVCVNKEQRALCPGLLTPLKIWCLGHRTLFAPAVRYCL